jgi:hypothetical protein
MPIKAARLKAFPKVLPKKISISQVITYDIEDIVRQYFDGIEPPLEEIMQIVVTWGLDDLHDSSRGKIKFHDELGNEIQPPEGTF